MPYGGYAPNGNLMAHSDSVMGDWLFDYDTLNRLTVAAPADNAPSNYAHTIGCFGYDSFGNRTMAGFIGNSDCSSSRTATATYNSKNQVTLVSQGAPISYSAPSGFSYDNAGNATVDGKNSYRYDAEGRISTPRTKTCPRGPRHLRSGLCLGRRGGQDAWRPGRSSWRFSPGGGPGRAAR